MDWSPFIISLKTASLAIIITFFIGIFLARYVTNIKSDKIKSIIDGILIVPLVLPPTVVGFILLLIFGVNRPVGKFLLEFLGVKIVFSWVATVIAAVIVSFPLMYRSARGAFEQVDEELIMAGRTLGMSEEKIFWSVVIPNALPGVASGGFLAFARGLGEFGATAMIAGNIASRTRTIPLAIYSEVVAGNTRGAHIYVIVILIVSFTLLFLMNYVTYKRKKY